MFGVKRPVLEWLTPERFGKFVRIHGYVSSSGGDRSRINTGTAEQMVGIVAANSVHYLRDLIKGKPDGTTRVE